MNATVPALSCFLGRREEKLSVCECDGYDQRFWNGTYGTHETDGTYEIKAASVIISPMCLIRPISPIPNEILLTYRAIKHHDQRTRLHPCAWQLP